VLRAAEIEERAPGEIISKDKIRCENFQWLLSANVEITIDSANADYQLGIGHT